MPILQTHTATSPQTYWIALGSKMLNLLKKLKSTQSVLIPSLNDGILGILKVNVFIMASNRIILLNWSPGSNIIWKYWLVCCTDSDKEYRQKDRRRPLPRNEQTFVVGFSCTVFDGLSNELSLFVLSLLVSQERPFESLCRFLVITRYTPPCLY